MVLALRLGELGESATVEELDRLIGAFVRAVVARGGELRGLEQGRLLASWGGARYERDDPLRAGLAALEVKRVAEESDIRQGMRVAVALSGPGDDLSAPLAPIWSVPLPEREHRTGIEILISDAVLETAGEHLVTEPIKGIEGAQRLVGLSEETGLSDLESEP